MANSEQMTWSARLCNIVVYAKRVDDDINFYSTQEAAQLNNTQTPECVNDKVPKMGEIIIVTDITATQTLPYELIGDGIKSIKDLIVNKQAGAAHAEGWYTKASVFGSHAEGVSTHATASGAHAEGYNSQATATGAHAEGKGTIAQGVNQHVQGQYNEADSTKAHIVGWGSDDTNRKNIHTLDKEGNAWFAGKVDTPQIKTKEIVTAKIIGGTDGEPVLITNLYTERINGKDANDQIGDIRLTTRSNFNDDSWALCNGAKFNPLDFPEVMENFPKYDKILTQKKLSFTNNFQDLGRWYEGQNGIVYTLDMSNWRRPDNYQGLLYTSLYLKWYTPASLRNGESLVLKQIGDYFDDISDDSLYNHPLPYPISSGFITPDGRTIHWLHIKDWNQTPTSSWKDIGTKGIDKATNQELSYNSTQLCFEYDNKLYFVYADFWAKDRINKLYISDGIVEGELSTKDLITMQYNSIATLEDDTSGFFIYTNDTYAFIIHHLNIWYCKKSELNTGASGWKKIQIIESTGSFNGILIDLWENCIVTINNKLYAIGHRQYSYSETERDPLTIIEIDFNTPSPQINFYMYQNCPDFSHLYTLTKTYYNELLIYYADYENMEYYNYHSILIPINEHPIDTVLSFERMSRASSCLIPQANPGIILERSMDTNDNYIGHEGYLCALPTVSTTGAYSYVKVRK